MRSAALVLPLAAICVSVAGCGQEGVEGEVRQVAERFHAAVERGDGEAACEELSEDAASELESQEKKPCAQAILTLELGGGEPARAQVFMNSASVDLVEGGRDFLGLTSEGWRLTAVACTPVQGQPYDCELEV